MLEIEGWIAITAGWAIFFSLMSIESSIKNKGEGAFSEAWVAASLASLSVYACVKLILKATGVS